MGNLDYITRLNKTSEGSSQPFTHSANRMIKPDSSCRKAESDARIAVIPEMKIDVITCGDCRSVLQRFPSESIDLIFTSPPYADRRKNVYGGIHPDKYVEWFKPISSELYRVLKPEGSFVLNIKEKTVDGQRHTYVLELILALKEQGWLWTEEYCWHKRNCYPGKWPNRFRDAWERLLHFTKQKQFTMHQEEVMVPVGEWAEKRLSYLNGNDLVRDESRSKSGFGKRIANWVGRDRVYPTNVLHLATECANRNHAAAFPIELPTWFIKLLTDKGDVVLDPFVGCGTTAIAAKQLERHYFGIDIVEDYCAMARDALKNGRRKHL